MHNSRSAPFSIAILAPEYENGSQVDKVDVSFLLPASYGDDRDSLNNPDSSEASIFRCIETDLDLKRLSDLQKYLWMSGRPMPPRPLHYQQVLGRDIRITERMDMHLIWDTSGIFIKPVPRFLLDPRFWRSHICCKDACRSSDETAVCECRRRWKKAFGFLLSYAALISHKSDFRIAREKALLPPETSWPAWRTLVRQLLDSDNVYTHVDPRFYYGELRLNRLNKGYYLWKSRPYKARWNQYSSFFRDNFAVIAAWTLCVAVVLTAMQVGLATDALQKSPAFQAASYGFTVFSILGPLVGGGLIVLVFLYFFVCNWVATTACWRKRMAIITSRPEAGGDFGSSRLPHLDEDHPPGD